MLVVFFIFKAFGFGLLGFGLDFLLKTPSGGYHVLSFIYLVGAKCFPSST
jgi:hypothetical protein